MQCKSLWIKASAKCINVNVNVLSQPVAGVPMSAIRGHSFWIVVFWFWTSFPITPCTHDYLIILSLSHLLIRFILDLYPVFQCVWLLDYCLQSLFLWVPLWITFYVSVFAPLWTTFWTL